MKLKNDSGFTLVEVTIAIILVGILVTISLSKINWNNKISSGVSSQIISCFGEIETAYGLYLSDKNTSPTGLADATFVPIYLAVPPAPTGFDSSYGTSGFILGLQTGQASPNNGYYIATRVIVSGTNDPKWNGIIQASNQLPTTKFNYNTTTPAITNMGAPAGATTVYLTYWITRY